VTTAGDGYCWGYAEFGQIGNGLTVSSNVPVEISDNHTWASIDTGGGFTCGVTTADGGYCWGFNGLGAVGDGTVTQRATPVEVVTPWAG